MGCTRFVEFGPGKVLSGLVKKIDASLAALIRKGARCTPADREGALRLSRALKGADISLTALLSAMPDHTYTEDLG